MSSMHNLSRRSLVQAKRSTSFSLRMLSLIGMAVSWLSQIWKVADNLIHQRDIGWQASCILALLGTLATSVLGFRFYWKRDRKGEALLSLFDLDTCFFAMRDCRAYLAGDDCPDIGYTRARNAQWRGLPAATLSVLLVVQCFPRASMCQGVSSVLWPPQGHASHAFHIKDLGEVCQVSDETHDKIPSISGLYHNWQAVDIHGKHLSIDLYREWVRGGDLEIPINAACDEILQHVIDLWARAQCDVVLLQPRRGTVWEYSFTSSAPDKLCDALLPELSSKMSGLSCALKALFEKFPWSVAVKDWRESEDIRSFTHPGTFLVYQFPPTLIWEAAFACIQILSSCRALTSQTPAANYGVSVWLLTYLHIVLDCTLQIFAVCAVAVFLPGVCEWKAVANSCEEDFEVSSGDLVRALFKSLLSGKSAMVKLVPSQMPQLKRVLAALSATVDTLHLQLPPMCLPWIFAWVMLLAIGWLFGRSRVKKGTSTIFVTSPLTSARPATLSSSGPDIATLVCIRATILLVMYLIPLSQGQSEYGSAGWELMSWSMWNFHLRQRFFLFLAILHGCAASLSGVMAIFAMQGEPPSRSQFPAEMRNPTLLQARHVHHDQRQEIEVANLHPSSCSQLASAWQPAGLTCPTPGKYDGHMQPTFPGRVYPQPVQSQASPVLNANTSSVAGSAPTWGLNPGALLNPVQCHV